MFGALFVFGGCVCVWGMRLRLKLACRKGRDVFNFYRQEGKLICGWEKPFLVVDKPLLILSKPFFILSRSCCFMGKLLFNTTGKRFFKFVKKSLFFFQVQAFACQLLVEVGYAEGDDGGYGSGMLLVFGDVFGV